MQITLDIIYYLVYYSIRKKRKEINAMYYKVNGSYTTKSLAEWFFGKKFVRAAEKDLLSANKSDGTKSIKVWQDGTGYLTVVIG